VNLGHYGDDASELQPLRKRSLNPTERSIKKKFWLEARTTMSERRGFLARGQNTKNRPAVRS